MISRTFALAIGVFGAIGASQLPEFAQQYRQRLGGALDELATIVNRFDREAAGEGLTRAQGLERLKAAPDPFSRQRADADADAIARHARLKEQRDLMTGSGQFIRVLSLITDGDRELIDRTMTDFEPAVPVTTEGAALAAGGFAGGYAIIRMIVALFRRKRVAARTA